MSGNQPNRRNLTDRQLKRRQHRYDSILGSNDNVKVVAPVSINKDNYKQIFSFGKDSKVFSSEKRFLIDICNNDMNNIDPIELANIISNSRSPVLDFFKKTNNGIPSFPIRPAKHNMLHIGIWMNNVSHYSGGRVHILLAAHLLAVIGHKVTIVTDVMPKMLNDFKYFEVEDRVEFIHGDVCEKSNWLLKNEFNNLNIVIATPRILEAFAYSRKWNLPCYGLLLESPNFVSEHRGGLDGTETYWREYKQCLLQYANTILSNPGPTLDSVKKWLGEAGYQGNYFEFPPAINTTAADRVFCEEENEITFIGRHLDFKCPDDVIKAVGKINNKIKPSINFVGSHNKSVRERLQNCADVNAVTVRFYAGVNDFEKYYIIKRSKLIVIPSRFEGFGMPPAEALYCKKPVVVYDLEITKWIYGDAVNYIKPGDLKSMALKISELCGNFKLRNKQGEYGYKQMWSPKSNIPCLQSKIKNQICSIFYGSNYPKITAGIIVLNGVDTLKYTLDSIYHSVEKILIVEGVVEDYAVNNSKLIRDGHSVDGTINFITSYPDPANKIELITIEDVLPKRHNKCFKNKNEMQNVIARRIKTELYLKVDADEVWKESDIEYVRRCFMLKKDLTVIYMQRWHFWKNLQTVATGGQWDSAEARAWRWNEEFRHDETAKGGFNYFIDANDNKVADPNYKCLKIMMRMHYHLGYCREDVHIKGKINYYANRGIEQNVKDNYSNWEPGMPTNSTHPNGTTAQQFQGTLPIILDVKNYSDIVVVDPKEVSENNNTMLSSPNK